MTKGKISTVMLFALITLLVELNCYGQDTPVACPDITDVSLIQLISNPDKFDGKLVRFIGFANLEFEGDAIYIREDDYKNGITKNGLWVGLTEAQRKNTEHKLNRIHVIVEGTFNAKEKGHMDLFSGTIENIKRFEPWVVKRGDDLKKKSCKEHPMLSGPCFKVKGRMFLSNGTPSVRIWPVGTKRILGISEARFQLDEYSNVPNDIIKQLSWKTSMYADFKVCPFTNDKPGVMRLVCVESAEKISIRDR